MLLALSAGFGLVVVSGGACGGAGGPDDDAGGELDSPTSVVSDAAGAESLDRAAEQFVSDLGAGNVSALAAMFTPEGLGKALILQERMQDLDGSTKLDFRVVESDATAAVVHFVATRDDQGAVIVTRWVSNGVTWRIDDISIN